MARMYRLHRDSSYLEGPRVFARVFCDPGMLRDTVRFYWRLTLRTLDMDMDLPANGSHVIAVGGFLILETDKGKLVRAGQVAETRVTVLAANLSETVAKQVAAGAQVAQERWESPPGPGMRLRHPDGLLVEYLEYLPSTKDVDEPGPDLRQLAV